jgi:hypothetical protein
MKTSLPKFDKLWNYVDPAGTEKKFREILAEAEDSQDFEYLAQLLNKLPAVRGFKADLRMHIQL